MRYLFKCCEERERLEKGLDTVQWEVKCTPFDKEDKVLNKNNVILIMTSPEIEGIKGARR